MGRLFNPHWQRIYQYPKSIKYLLWMLLLFLMATVIMYNVSHVMRYLYYDWNLTILISDVFDVSFVAADMIFSTFNLCLFLRPLCRAGNLVSPDIRKAVLVKYGVISALQLVAAATYELSVLVRWYLVLARHVVNDDLWGIATDILRVIQMLVLFNCICIRFTRIAIAPHIC